MSAVTRQSQPEWIWPRADSHVVLGVEGSPDVLKTFVEPGGTFSPGVGSFGVSLWVWLPGEQRLVAPERLERPEIRDRLLGGILPIHRSRWRAGELEVDLRLAVDSLGGRHQAFDTLAARIVNRGGQRVEARALLVVRSAGPAGGPVRAIAVNAEYRGLNVNDKPAVLGQRTPSAAGCHAPSEDGGELSLLLLRGGLPTRQRAADPDGWAAGCLAYDLALEPGGVWESGWDLPVWPSHPEPPALLATRAQLPAADRLERLADSWRDRLTQVDLQVPDTRIKEAFFASLAHLLMSRVGDEARIATICYPFAWMRDGVYMLNALDKAGLADRVRASLDLLVADPWAGGFGPEGDAPGQLLWLLGEHFLLTRDAEWLARVYPRVRERAELLRAMRRSREPLYADQSRVLPVARLHPEGHLVCEAARGGLIHGRMDWHRPVFWVNAWAFMGLRRAVELAAALGEEDDVGAWYAEAADLSKALAGPGARFGANERDWVCAIWPTDARHPDDPATRTEFDRHWTAHRLDAQRRYRGEPRWRYFELGEAHNYLRLGHRDRALLTIEQFLRTQDAPGLYAWAEGDHTGDPVGDWRFVRGWWPDQRLDAHRGSAILPHGWVSAEMVLLLRDLFVFEDDGWLVLGGGLAPEWLRSGETLSAARLPTHYGELSWQLAPQADGQGWTMTIHCSPAPPLGYRLRLPLPPSASVEVDGVGIREEQGDWPLALPAKALTVTITVP
jgi:hypothetical protein